MKFDITIDTLICILYLFFGVESMNRFVRHQQNRTKHLGNSRWTLPEHMLFIESMWSMTYAILISNLTLGKPFIVINTKHCMFFHYIGVCANTTLYFPVVYVLAYSAVKINRNSRMGPQFKGERERGQCGHWGDRCYKSSTQPHNE